MTSKPRGFVHILVIVVLMAAAAIILGTSLRKTIFPPAENQILGESQVKTTVAPSVVEPPLSIKDSDETSQQTQVGEAEKPEPKELHEQEKNRERNKETVQERTTETKYEQETENLKISTSSGETEIKSNNIRANIHFPLSINATTGALIVTTPAGTKTVAILPDKAVENMIRKKFITVIDNSQPIEVATVEGQLAYEIQGRKNYKFLGLFDVSRPVTTDVSTENGTVLSVTQSPLDSLLNLLSF